ncbi:MAG: DoxX family protein [Litorimonas sp.]
MTTLTQTPLTQTSTPSRPALPGLASLDRATARFAPVLGRLLIGGMFASAGLSKIGAYAGTQGYMESVGLPGGLLPLVIGFEILAGFMLIAGWKTRAVAFVLAGFTVVTAVTFHAELSDPVQSLFFYKNLAIAGGLLVLAGMGGGRYALDGRRP